MDGIDYCTIFTGKNVKVLAEVSYRSLFKTTDLKGVTFHVINKGCSQEDMYAVKAILSETDNAHYFHNSPEAITGRGPGGGVGNHDNVALNANFAMTSCGKNRWCVLAHFDIRYKGDFLAFLKPMMTDSTALLGQHERFLMVNREAYKQSNVKFTSIAPFLAAPLNKMAGPSDPNHWLLPDNGDYKLRFAGDPRITRGSVPVRGFDTGELLELEMMAYGWVAHPLICELRNYIEHFGGGGTNHDDPQVTSMRERATQKLREMGRVSEDMEQVDLHGRAVTLIHFISEVSAPPIGEKGPSTLQQRIACMPNMTEFHQTIYHPAYMRSNDPRAVNCPACKKSQVFTHALEELTGILKRVSRG